MNLFLMIALCYASSKNIYISKGTFTDKDACHIYISEPCNGLGILVSRIPLKNLTNDFGTIKLV